MKIKYRRLGKLGTLLCQLVFILVIILTSSILKQANKLSASPPEQGLKRASFTVDGVPVTLVTPFLPSPTLITSPPGASTQIANSASWRPFRELTVLAVPFGTKPGGENLPIAEPAGRSQYDSALRDFRARQGGDPKPGPAVNLFGKKIGGIVSLVHVNLDGATSKATYIAEWVVEAGPRIWIVRLSEEITDSTSHNDALSDLLTSVGELTLDSTLLNNPSTLTSPQSDGNTQGSMSSVV